jgi:hypothetical protein
MSQRKALLVALYLAAHGRFGTGVQILNSQPKLRFHIEDALRTTRWEFFTSALFVSVDRYKSKIDCAFYLQGSRLLSLMRGKPLGIAPCLGDYRDIGWSTLTAKWSEVREARFHEARPEGIYRGNFLLIRQNRETGKNRLGCRGLTMIV